MCDAGKERVKKKSYWTKNILTKFQTFKLFSTNVDFKHKKELKLFWVIHFRIVFSHTSKYLHT
jgi:hypothetical protein